MASLLAGCKPAGSTEPAAEPEPTAVAVSPAENSSLAHEDYSAMFGHKLTVSEDTVLFRLEEDALTEAGTLHAGALLDIGSEQRDDLVAIADSRFYVKGSALTASDRWYRNETHLLEYGQDIRTLDTYHIQDEAGSVIAEVNGSDFHTVYVQPSEDDARYGIRFMNAIYYIEAAEVEEVLEADRIIADDICTSMPVLMYHFFYSEADGGSRKDGNWVEVNELEEQLNYISEHDFTACSMREVQYWMESRARLPEQSIAITIDDADPSVHQYAMPVFTKYGIHATNFVICGWQPPEMPYELWEMRENGMELQSHGFLTHTGGCSGMGHGGILMCMDHDEGVEDTKRSFDYVDGGFVYCYPFGDINENAESIVRDGGAKLAFTTQGGWIDPSMDPLALPRVRVVGGNGISAYVQSISAGR